MKRKFLVAVLVTSALLASASHAAVDAAVTTAITDQTSVFTDVKTYILAVVIFINVIAVLKMLRKK